MIVPGTRGKRFLTDNLATQRLGGLVKPQALQGNSIKPLVKTSGIIGFKALD